MSERGRSQRIDRALEPSGAPESEERRPLDRSGDAAPTSRHADEVARLRFLVGPDERSYEELRYQLTLARAHNAELEAELGALRARLRRVRARALALVAGIRRPLAPIERRIRARR